MIHMINGNMDTQWSAMATNSCAQDSAQAQAQGQALHYTCSEVCREECKRGLIKLIAFSLLVHCGGSSSRSNFRFNCTEALAFTEADNEAACAHHHHQHSVGYGLGTKMETFISVWNSLLCLPLLPNSISHDSASTNTAFPIRKKR